MRKLSVVIVLYVGLFLHAGAQNYAKDKSIQPSSAKLIFNSDAVVVDPGQRLQLDCGVDGEYRYCFWERGGVNPETFQVEDVHGGYLTRLSKPDNSRGNECGIVINSVSADDHGEWTCRVFVVAKNLFGNKNVVVTVKPQQPILGLKENPFVVSEGEEREVLCTVPAARPAAEIRWFVGTEDVTVHSNTETTPTDEVGTYRSVSNLRYKFHHSDDRKGLRCSIKHPTLQEPEYSEIPLDVRYAPHEISPTEIYGIPMESEYEIKYNFTSNPTPDLTWVVDDLEIPVPAETERFKTSIRTLMDNVYMAVLRINEFTSDDLGKTYRLHVKNDLGEKNIDISLSTGPPPVDGRSEVSSVGIVAPRGSSDEEESIGAGTLASIVVIVLLILILLFIIGVMRYRQMYCFGSRDRIKNHLKESGENLKEEHSDTESTREPSVSKGKATNLFRNLTSFMKPKKGEKEPRLDKIEEGDAKDEQGSKGSGDGKSNNPSEIVYAELDLSKGDKARSAEKGKSNEATEYAEIVGTISDNKAQEKRA